ncbi:MAG: M28 family peptidase [Anaerolineae bacterium]|nr:M28 family peptidase [Anaerolineae bacterium]
MIDDILSQVSVERIREHIQALEGVRHPIAAPEALEQAAGYIQRTFESCGYAAELRPFSAHGREFYNLVATRRGTRLPDERVLIIAHYDTVENSPGADDNASGVAALLELARLLAPLQFERTVQLVAVNLEERQVAEGPLDTAGLFGSRALAAEAREEGWQIVGAIVLESIAYAGAGIVQKSPDGLPISLPEVGDFLGVVGNEASKKLVSAFTQATGRYQIPLPIVPLVVPGKGEMLPDTRRSDHAPFWDQGYPAVMLTDTANFRSPHYHQPADTLDTCNLAFATDVCRVVMGVVVDVAGLMP